MSATTSKVAQHNNPLESLNYFNSDKPSWWRFTRHAQDMGDIQTFSSLSLKELPCTGPELDLLSLDAFNNFRLFSFLWGHKNMIPESWKDKVKGEGIFIVFPEVFISRKIKGCRPEVRYLVSIYWDEEEKDWEISCINPEYSFPNNCFYPVFSLS